MPDPLSQCSGTRVTAFAARLSLDGGQTFTSEVGAPTAELDTYTRQHAPQLVDAYLTTDKLNVILSFDVQPTDRAGMLGFGPCAIVLDDNTISRLTINRVDDVPMCGWTDDSTLVLYLSAAMPPMPGFTFTTRAGAVKPKVAAGNEYGITNDRSPLIFTIPATIATPSRANSVHPGSRHSSAVAASCSGTSLKLEDAFPQGRLLPLVYRWSAVPRDCDKYWSVSNGSMHLVMASVQLLADELTGKEYFTFRLTVTDFLGASSTVVTHTVTRASEAVPTLLIDAPPLVYVIFIRSLIPSRRIVCCLWTIRGKQCDQCNQQAVDRSFQMAICRTVAPRIQRRVRRPLQLDAETSVQQQQIRLHYAGRRCIRCAQHPAWSHLLRCAAKETRVAARQAHSSTIVGATGDRQQRKLPGGRVRDI